MLDPPGGGAAITIVTWFASVPPGSLKGLVHEVDDIAPARTRLAAGGNGLVLQQCPPPPPRR